MSHSATINKAGANFKVNRISEIPQNPLKSIKRLLRFHKINRVFTKLIFETLRVDIIPSSKEHAKVILTPTRMVEEDWYLDYDQKSCQHRNSVYLWGNRLQSHWKVTCRSNLNVLLARSAWRDEHKAGQRVSLETNFVKLYGNGIHIQIKQERASERRIKLK